jgi:hypothetical protein
MNYIFLFKPMSATNSSICGIVKASLIGFSLDFAWTNLSATPYTLTQPGNSAATQSMLVSIPIIILPFLVCYF